MKPRQGLAGKGSPAGKEATSSSAIPNPDYKDVAGVFFCTSDQMALSEADSGGQGIAPAFPTSM